MLATGLLASCGLLRGKPQEEKPEKKEDTEPRLVGRIASVPLDKRFVLVQNYGAANFDTGAVLTSRGPDERVANLRVTGEKLGQFVAADVQSGAVEVGDAVFFHPPPAINATPPTVESLKSAPPGKKVP